MKNFIHLQPRAWGFVNQISRIFLLVLCGVVLGFSPLYAHEPAESVHGSASPDKGFELSGFQSNPDSPLGDKSIH
jgi:hypothetical protein